jgi:hypothetical protein
MVNRQAVAAEVAVGVAPDARCAWLAPHAGPIAGQVAAPGGR